MAFSTLIPHSPKSHGEAASHSHSHVRVPLCAVPIISVAETTCAKLNLESAIHSRDSHGKAETEGFCSQSNRLF